MFGYIYPEKQELKIKEYSIYKSYYCSICNSLGKRFGITKRFMLNYDITFLSILLSSYTKTQEIESFRCFLNPFKHMPEVKNNDIIDYAADIGVLLGFYKLKDNWDDDKSIKSLFEYLYLKRTYKKASQKIPLQNKIIVERLRELQWLEKEKCGSIDQISDVMGRMVRDIMIYSPIKIESSERKALSWMCYNLGKWIYVIDAFDDIEDDYKNNSYNIFLKQYKPENESIVDFKNEIRDNVRFYLTQILSQIGQALELSNIMKNRNLIENIIYLGMNRCTENVITGRSLNRNERSVQGTGSQRRSLRRGNKESIQRIG